MSLVVRVIRVAVPKESNSVRETFYRSLLARLGPEEAALFLDLLEKISDPLPPISLGPGSLAEHTSPQVPAKAHGDPGAQGASGDGAKNSQNGKTSPRSP